MKLLSMPNDAFLSQGDGNAMSIQERILELLKLKIYPVSIQFESEEDINDFVKIYQNTNTK